MERVRRDWLAIDSATGLPRCYGHEDPLSNTCLTCDVQIPCRETLRMGAGSPVLIVEDDRAVVESIRAELDAEDEEDDEVELEDEVDTEEEPID